MLGEALEGRTAPAQLLDLGCGEGYYSARLEQALLDSGIAAELNGLDISKPAVRAACQRSRSIRWLVASGAEMPFADASFDAVSLLFSRLMPDELARVLKPGGLLLIAWPGEDHLIELRRLIYREVRPSGYDPLSQLGDRFRLCRHERVQYRLSLDSADSIQALLGMTPHSRRMPQASRDALAALSRLELGLDVNLALCERR
ncbi:methyltransferase domain-containing protein [Marinobacterium aestuariivivens]|uniref:Methyltransferase domain-containing protein n=1 Tax=Marinobacterium aestuariivivens TaxID=1698799 RepID=A0ABW2A1V1_9GAMM